MEVVCREGCSRHGGARLLAAAAETPAGRLSGGSGACDRCGCGGGAADVQLLDHNVLVWRAAAAAAGTACTCGARRSGGKQTAATRKTKPAGRKAEKTFRFSSRDDAADLEKRKIQTVSGKC